MNVLTGLLIIFLKKKTNSEKKLNYKSKTTFIGEGNTQGGLTMLKETDTNHLIRITCDYKIIFLDNCSHCLYTNSLFL